MTRPAGRRWSDLARGMTRGATPPEQQTASCGSSASPTGTSHPGRQSFPIRGSTARGVNSSKPCVPPHPDLNAWPGSGPQQRPLLALWNALLQVHDPEPSVELEADPAHAPHLDETELLVQPDRGVRPLVADRRDDLADAGVPARLQERFEQRRTEALPGSGLTEVDGVFDGVPVGGLRLPRLHQRIAEDLSARALGHQERHRSEEHTSELQSLMRTSYAGFCLKKKHNNHQNLTPTI